MILAGGEGKRLYPLTKDRSKPAVSFGGRYRIIDFVLSNFVNSGLTKIKVLTQFKSDSLNRHLARGWQLSPMIDQYIDPVPAQMRTGKDWYRGTADAIYQNMNLIRDEDPDIVCVFGGDHVYKMDIRQMLNYHLQKKADLTVSALQYPREKSSEFGIVEIDSNWRITGFAEKPSNPRPIPGDPKSSLVSMGNYIFNAKALMNVLEEDAACNSEHDFGKNIIISMIGSHRVYAYDFLANNVPGYTEAERGYWRDVGTLDQYWEASMDLCSVSPVLNMYNELWPIMSVYRYGAPPAKFVFATEGKRIGMATDSLVSEGCVVSGGKLHRCVLSPWVRVNSYSTVEESVLMDGVEVGRYAKIRRAIIDKNVTIPSEAVIGYDLEKDKERFHVTENGIVVIPKGMVIEG